MLTKLETKSNRVKGLSFHPSRPWILASLHSGIIQLWDYRNKTLVDKFDEHDGPVRGICFHSSQPLFVSGGDDYKIKIWNYKQRRCLFTLLGHLDYIRTVQFHHEYPWILSSSDDQTIRIWNWQSRNCIAVLTGHNHYVMSASFHPKEDLIVSASLDQTVRVWDVSGLRKKTVSPGAISVHSREDPLKFPQNDLFGNTDAIVKYVLEGHDRGVNWAAFHPNMPLIVSGADDRQVKLWRMNETKAWEVDTFRGHFNNVSCVLFHPRQELIISNSEDKTIRIWEIQKRQGIQTFRREHDRFWILAAHPLQNLFAAGHDNGLLVFKLERERPAFAVQNDSVLYVKDRYIRSYDFAGSQDIPVLSIRGRTGIGSSSGGSSTSSSIGNSNSNRIRSILFDLQEKALLVLSDADGGSYELYQIPKENRNLENIESKRGSALSAVFIGRKRFALLDRSHQVVIKNLKNEPINRFYPSSSTLDTLFPAPPGYLLFKSEDKLSLYDLQQKKSVGDLSISSEVKFVYWSPDKSSLVALITKDHLFVANRKLEQLFSVHETVRIKSGAWDSNEIFIYSTANHLKYCLRNGDNGIIRTLDSTLYIVSVKGNRVICLDRELKFRIISIDTTEYMFKHALIQGKYNQVLKMVKEYNLIGCAIISYLQKKGFPEVALYFVKDEKTRFNLALECGNIEVALESAKVLDDKEGWHRLGIEALRQGNHQIVEMAYQRTKDFERLSFLYLITGNTEKLKKMLKISEIRQDVMSRFHNALYLGDINERIRLLEEVGLLSLAYVTAASHSLKERANEIASKMPTGAMLPKVSLDAQLLYPPIPILRSSESNWPLLTVSKGYFDGATIPGEKERSLVSSLDEEEIPKETEWDNMQIPDDEEEEGTMENGNSTSASIENIASSSTEPSAWDIDLEIDGELEKVEIGAPDMDKKISTSVFPHSGPSFAQIWCQNSSLAADHIAAGSFESAMKLLNEQIGVVNFLPLKPFFMEIYYGSRLSIPSLPLMAPWIGGLQRNGSDAGPRGGLPMLSFGLHRIIEGNLKTAYRLTTGGKFSDALQQFIDSLQRLPLIVVDSKKEINEAKELLGICREYITGLRMELYRKELSTANGDVKRQAELAAYFTHCNLQAIHLMLSLRSAMNCAYKIKNYQSASGFARRLLELDPPNDVATQAKKVVKFSEQNNSNAVNLNYNERNPFVICGISFVPIYKGSPLIQCPFCQTSFLPEHKAKLCPTCKLAQIGKEVSGMQLFNVPQRSEREKLERAPTSFAVENDAWD